jgi:carbamoyl-phosphate synthase large subunit
MLFMEYLSGEEITVDCYRGKGGFIAIPRVRKAMRSGISFDCQGIDDPEIMYYSKQIAETLDLRYAFGFQYKRNDQGVPCLLECNPRVQGSMVHSTLAGSNVVWYAVKDVLREKVVISEPQWDYRMIRYWGAMGLNNGEQDARI